MHVISSAKIFFSGCFLMASFLCISLHSLNKCTTGSPNNAMASSYIIHARIILAISQSIYDTDTVYYYCPWVYGFIAAVLWMSGCVPCSIQHNGGTYITGEVRKLRWFVFLSSYPRRLLLPPPPARPPPLPAELQQETRRAAKHASGQDYGREKKVLETQRCRFILEKRERSCVFAKINR